MFNNGFVRIFLFLTLLVAAIAFYSMGIKSGAFLLIIMGFLIEGAAWLALFKRKKSINTMSKSK